MLLACNLFGYDELGLPEYEGIEAFVRWEF